MNRYTQIQIEDDLRQIVGDGTHEDWFIELVDYIENLFTTIEQKDKEIDDLKDTVEDLQDDIEALQTEIDNLRESEFE